MHKHDDRDASNNVTAQDPHTPKAPIGASRPCPRFADPLISRGTRRAL